MHTMRDERIRRIPLTPIQERDQQLLLDRIDPHNIPHEQKEPHRQDEPIEEEKPVASILKELVKEVNGDDVLMCLVSLVVLVILAVFTYKVFEKHSQIRHEELVLQNSSWVITNTSKLLFGIFQPLECDPTCPLSNVSSTNE